MWYPAITERLILPPSVCGENNKGIWYRLEEYYYHSRLTGTSRTDEEHYAGLVALIAGRPVAKIVVDPSAASFITVIQRHGAYLVLPAKNDVVDGASVQ